MGKDYTKFQTWVLFITFGNNGRLYTSRDLLFQCCDSAIRDLKEEHIGIELKELVESGLLDTNPNQDPQSYQISDSGILYMRKVLSEIQEQIKLHRIPEYIVKNQDDEMQTSIGQGEVIRDTIVKSGIKNIGPILEIIKFVIPFMN